MELWSSGLDIYAYMEYLCKVVDSHVEMSLHSPDVTPSSVIITLAGVETGGGRCIEKPVTVVRPCVLAELTKPCHFSHTHTFLIIGLHQRNPLAF